MAENSARRQPTPLPLGRSITPVFEQPGDCEEISASALRSEKSRRRGSLSVSRFGQVRHIRSAFDVQWCPSFPDSRKLGRRCSLPDWYLSVCVRRVIARAQIPFICSATCEFCRRDHDAFISLITWPSRTGTERGLVWT